MYSVIAMLIVGISLFFVGWAVLQLRKTIMRLFTLVNIQNQHITNQTNLSNQVKEIHHTMGGVINSLKAMGHQVHNLNLLAGHALQGGQDQQVPTQLPNILIEIHPATEEGIDIQKAILEDLPPEMLERFRAFQSVYSAIIASDNFPSRNNPDMN